MKSSKILLLFMLLILSYSCKNKVSNLPDSDDEIAQAETFQEIDLAGNLKDCGEKLLLSDVADSVEYIRLETNSNSLLGRVQMLRTTDKYVFVACIGQNLALVFDRRTGKFIRKLGKIGQGPGEIISVRTFAANDSLMYISSNYRSEEFYAYNVVNNSFARKIRLEYPVGLNGNIVFLNNNIVYYPGYMPEQNICATACILSPKGELLNIQNPYLGPDFDSKRPEMVLLDAGCNWGYKSMENAHSVINDTIYGISSDSIFPRFHLSLGKYKMPVEEYNPRNGGWEKYILIDGVWETGDYLLLTFRYDCKQWYSRYDKRTKSVKSWARTPTLAVHWTPGEFEGITNDLDGFMAVRKPRYADRNHFISVIDSDNKDKVREDLERNKDVKFPEKRKELMKMIDEMGEDDNPIIVFYRLKD